MLIETLNQCIPAAAGLGMASFALVDATKVLGGGVSNFGFGQISQVVNRFLPEPNENDRGPLGLNQLMLPLRANWLNGMPLDEQKAIAKSLIKLKLSTFTAEQYASVTGLNASVMSSIAGNIIEGKKLSPEESDVWGRFDLILTAILDQCYERADQIYRNGAKAVSVVVSVGLAAAGAAFYKGAFVDWRLAILVGLAATPVAPIAKDLTSALAAGVKVAETLRRK